MIARAIWRTICKILCPPAKIFLRRSEEDTPLVDEIPKDYDPEKVRREIRELNNKLVTLDREARLIQGDWK